MSSSYFPQMAKCFFVFFPAKMKPILKAYLQHLQSANNSGFNYQIRKRKLSIPCRLLLSKECHGLKKYLVTESEPFTCPFCTHFMCMEGCMINYTIIKTAISLSPSIHPVSFHSSEVRWRWQHANQNIPDIALPWDTLLLLPGEPEVFTGQMRYIISSEF